MKAVLVCLLAVAVVAAQVLGLAQPVQAFAASHLSAQTPPTPPVTDSLAFLDSVRAQETLLATDFSTEEGPWRVETTDDTALAFEEESYHITIDASDTLEWSTAEISVADFLAEVDTTFVAGPGTSQFGLFFRYVDDMNAYLFTISGDGMYQLYKLADGGVEMLVEETESELIEAGRGAANRLGVLAQGATITLLVNGSVLTQMQDEAFAEGDIALAAGTLNGRDTEIAFDNLAVWDLAALPEPTEEPTSEPTPEPTSQPTTEPTTEPPAPTEEATAGSVELERALQTILAAVRAEEPLLSESFTRDRGDWPTGADGVTERSYANRAYHIKVAAPDQAAWSPAGRSAADFLAEVQAVQEATTPGSYAGLLFRYTDDENFYAFLIDDDAQFRLERHVDGEITTLVDWQHSENLAGGTGAENLLSVLASDSRILLLANDVLLAQVTDETFGAGDVALVAGTQAGDGVEAVFDDLEVWDAAPAADLLAALAAPAPIPTPEPTATAPVFDPAALDIIHAEEPVLSESFTRDRGEWSTETTEDSERFFAGRAYHLKVFNPNRIGWTNAETPLADSLVEVQATHVAGPLAGDFGLLFRFQDEDNFYRFSVTGNGEYALDKLVGDAWETLIEPTASTALAAGEGASNRLGVLARGSTIVLLADDEVLAVVDDGEFAAGDFALVAGTYEEPDLEVAFDDLEIWDLAPLAAQLEGAFGAVPALTPAPTATATPIATPETEEPTATPEPTTAAEPTETSGPVGFSLDDVEISWGPIWDFADILGDPRVERRTVTLFTGETRDADVIAADVVWFDLPFLEEYTAYFYDAGDVEVAEPLPVLLEPLPEDTGDEGEVWIVLPEEMVGVKYIDVDY